MREAIRNVVAKIKIKHIFDSHYVINQLLQNNSNAFYRFIRSKRNTDTKATNGLLAQAIQRCPGVVKANAVYQSLGSVKSWSENIHGTPSPCTLWIKTR